MKIEKQERQLVLLHGLFGSPLGLENIATDLRQAGYEVFVPAVPPFAGSESLWSEQQNIMLDNGDLSQQYAEYFRKYFAENNIVEPILIGHSMGTLVASSIVKYHPELVNEKIILMSPISRSPNEFIARISVLSAYLPPKFTDWITTQFLIVSHNHKFFHDTLKMVHRCSLDQRPCRQYIKEATRFSANSSITENLRKAAIHGKRFQIYLLAGERDRLVSPVATRQAAAILEDLPNNVFSCKYDFLPKTGHLHNYEKPHETAQQIINFLES